MRAISTELASLEDSLIGFFLCRRECLCWNKATVLTCVKGAKEVVFCE